MKAWRRVLASLTWEAARASLRARIRMCHKMHKGHEDRIRLAEIAKLIRSGKRW